MSSKGSSEGLREVQGIVSVSRDAGSFFDLYEIAGGIILFFLNSKIGDFSSCFAFIRIIGDYSGNLIRVGDGFGQDFLAQRVDLRFVVGCGRCESRGSTTSLMRQNGS